MSTDYFKTKLFTQWKDYQSTHQSYEAKCLAPYTETGALSSLFKELNVDVKLKAFDPSSPIEILIDGIEKKLKAAGIKEPSTKAPVSTKRERKKTRIFIVDDSATVRRLLKQLIERSDAFEVCGEAEHPFKALEMLKTMTPDVMTLDINMPDMTGVEVLREIMQKKFIPTIVISSLNMAEGSQVLEAT